MSAPRDNVAPALIASVTLAALSAGCDGTQTDSVSVRDGGDTVTLFVSGSATIRFIDTGANIAVVELTPEAVDSVVEPFIAEGGTPLELFATFSDEGAPLPRLLQKPYARNPIDGGELGISGFRAWGYDGLYSNCEYYTEDEWIPFVENYYTDYDEYYHVAESTTNLAHYSDANVRRYYATMCGVRDHSGNTPPGVDINYEGWRKASGGSWVKLVDQDVPEGTRLRHWDDPGSDGWQWYVYVNKVPPPAGCSFICDSAKHHTSQMWDW